MKRLICVLVLITIAFNVHAADTLTTNFINAVYKEIVPANVRYYYLFNEGNRTIFNEDYLQYQLKNEMGHLKDVPFSDFLTAAKTDTSKINWGDFNLIKAKVADHQLLPWYALSIKIFKLFPYNTPDSVLKKSEHARIIPVLVKPHSSPKQIELLKQQALHRYEDRPQEEKISYQFSKPIFSNDLHFALIRLGSSEGSCLYIFKLIEGKWTKLIKFDCIIID